MKVKSESEVTQSCPTLSDPMDCSPPGSYCLGFARQEYWSGLPLPSPSQCTRGQETRIWSLGQEDPLEKETATHSSVLAWEIPQPEEPGRLQFMGWQRVWHEHVHIHRDWTLVMAWKHQVLITAPPQNSLIFNNSKMITDIEGLILNSFINSLDAVKSWSQVSE